MRSGGPLACVGEGAAAAAHAFSAGSTSLFIIVQPAALRLDKLFPSFVWLRCCPLASLIMCPVRILKKRHYE